MKVLVTGANGFLGSWLVRRLIDEGHQVTILARSSSDLSELQGLDYKKAIGDVLNKESLIEAMESQEAVFHLAGLIAYKKSQRSQMERVNVVGTQNILSAMEQVGVGRLLHLSSVVAIGAGLNSKQILNEESEFNIHHLNLGYFETKHQAELLVRQAAKNGKLHAVCVNPSTIYGRGDAKKGSRKTQIKVAQGKFPFYTPGGVNVVPVENTIDGIMRAFSKGKNGERYILSGENLLIKDLFQKIAFFAKVPAPQILLPSFALHTLGHLGDLLTSLGKETSLSSETAWTSTLYHWFDSGKAQKELGFQPGSADQAIENSVRWMKDNGLI